MSKTRWLFFFAVLALVASPMDSHAVPCDNDCPWNTDCEFTEPTMICVHFGDAEPSGVNEVVVPVLVSTRCDDEIEYSQFVVDFKSDCLTFVSASLGDATDDGGFEFRVAPRAQAGTVDFPIANADDGFDMHAIIQVSSSDPSFTYNGCNVHVVNLTFEIQPGCTGELRWDITELTTDVGRTNFNGYVTGGADFTYTAEEIYGINKDDIRGSISLAGNARYYTSSTGSPVSKPIQAVLVIGTQELRSKARTGVEGTFSAPTDPEGNYSDLGPFNATGVVIGTPGPVLVTTNFPTNIARDYPAIQGRDLNYLLQFLADKRTLTTDQQRAANVQGGDASLVTLSDAITIAEWLAFLPPSLGAPIDIVKWLFVFEHDIEGEQSRNIILDVGSRNPEPLDLRGIVLGDVDGSWPNSDNPKPQISGLELALNLVDWVGDEITVALHATVQEHAVETILYSLDYASQDLEYMGATNGSRSSGFFMMDNPQESGKAHGVLASGAANPVADSGDVMLYRFRILRPFESTQLSFSRLKVNDADLTDAPQLSFSSEGATVTTPRPHEYAMKIQPNPFNPSTVIEFRIPDLAGEVDVSLRAFDINGRLVRTLVHGKRSPGMHDVTWNGQDDHGRQLGTGVYFIRMNAGEWTSVQKVSLLK